MPKKNICHQLSFEDCELTILRMAVDKAEEKIGKRTVNSGEIQKIIKIVEDFPLLMSTRCSHMGAKSIPVEQSFTQSAERRYSNARCLESIFQTWMDSRSSAPMTVL